MTYIKKISTHGTINEKEILTSDLVNVLENALATPINCKGVEKIGFAWVEVEIEAPWHDNGYYEELLFVAVNASKTDQKLDPFNAKPIAQWRDWDYKFLFNKANLPIIAYWNEDDDKWVYPKDE